MIFFFSAVSIAPCPCIGSIGGSFVLGLRRAPQFCAAVAIGLDELQVAGGETWSAFEYGNNATVTKVLIGTIFVEVEATSLLVIEEVKIFLCKFHDLLLVLSSGKSCRSTNAEVVDIDFYDVF